MGQDDVLRVFKDNPGSFLSIKEVADILNRSFQATSRATKKLSEHHDLESKTITGNRNAKIILYKLNCTDDHFEMALHQYGILRNDSRLTYMSPEGLRQIMIIGELKKLNERMSEK